MSYISGTIIEIILVDIGLFSLYFTTTMSNLLRIKNLLKEVKASGFGMVLVLTNAISILPIEPSFTRNVSYIFILVYISFLTNIVYVCIIYCVYMLL